ncbi:MAG TPA: YceI family protein [Methylophilaceae bacterium]|nr:YceI family protein [Methylophilaceae bacterium]
MKKTTLLLALMLSWTAAQADTETYTIDNSHSFANWTIRHVASKAAGTFSDITGILNIDREHLDKSSVEARINVLSVNSSHAKRDAHIKKEEYLDAGRFGEMHFTSSKIVATSPTEGILTGTLTLHGVSKVISFPFKVLGFGTDPWGGYRTGIEAHTSLKASDYGFTWPLKPNAPVGDDIEITLLIEGVKKTADLKP